MSSRVCRPWTGVAAIAGLVAGAAADTVTLTPVKDNTLIENNSGALSNGEGDGLFCGRTGAFDGGTFRRAVLAFDVAAAVPAGSTIDSAELTLEVLLSAPGSNSEGTRLYRLDADWGEGESSSVGGAGAPSEPGDATWIHTFYSDELWATPGGDFSTLSAAIMVGMSGPQTWGSTAQMVADVQGWLDDPSSSYGWILVGNEAELQTARKFASRENLDPLVWPMLTIEYTAPACPWDCANDDGEIGVEEFLSVLGTWGEVGAPCDFDNDGVGIEDFLKVLGVWGPCP